MASPEPEDRFICSAWNEAAIAVGMNDSAACEEFTRKFLSFEGKLRLTAVGVATTNAGTGKGCDEPFTGRPMVSKFGGTCAVCGQGFPQGCDILYSGERKRAAHLRCGEVG